MRFCYVPQQYYLDGCSRFAYIAWVRDVCRLVLLWFPRWGDFSAGHVFRALVFRNSPIVVALGPPTLLPITRVVKRLRAVFRISRQEVRGRCVRPPSW